MQFEILAWDEWDNPEGFVYQVQAAWDLRQDLPKELLEQTRAVLFSIDRNWSERPDPQSPGPFGFSTCAEFWEICPDELEELLRQDLETWALLPLQEPFFCLNETNLLNIGPLLVRVGGEPQDSASPLYSRPFVPTRFGLSSVKVVNNPPGLLRNWSWGWRKTGGPVSFTARVPHDLESLTRWFERLELVEYEACASRLLPGSSRGRLADLYEPEQSRGSYHLPGCELANGYLDLFDGGFRLWSSFGKLGPSQASSDCTLLQSVLRGELGEDVQWEVFDGDYCSIHAHGPSLASLASYLDPTIAEEEERARWNVQTLTLDCGREQSWEDVWRVAGQHFGVDPADLGPYLSGLRAGEFPRSIRVVHQPLSGSLVLPKTRGIIWEFQLPAPAGTEAPSVTRTYPT